MTDRVPFVDLNLQNAQVLTDFETRLPELLRSGAFVLGPVVAQFEQEFAEYTGTGHCVGVANGTDALELALRAAGIGPGDDVVIPVNTFIATAEAVVRAGARPVLAEAGADHLIDPTSVAERLTPNTRAVVGVHLYGQMAPMEMLGSVVPAGTVLIEDAAQSQGATRHGRRSGSFGTVAATSFYPGKNLGAFGDAGAVTTDSADIAESVRALRNHGGTAKYEHRIVGNNSRLDSIQALALSLKLRLLDEWNQQRRAAATIYEELLGADDRVGLPTIAPGNEHVWHLYVVEVEDRDRIQSELAERGIGTGIHYPLPVHLTPAFAESGWQPGDFVADERRAQRILSLPMFPGITPGQQASVCSALQGALDRR